MSPTRRAFLSGSATVGLAGLGLTAGCVDDVGISGGGTTPSQNTTATEPQSDGEQSNEWVPAAQFSSAYSPAAETVTIYHTGGEVLAADNLAITGTGFADRSGVDQTAAGPWQGDTSQDGDVSAVHSVEVGVQDDWQLAVVWGDGTNSAVLWSETRTQSTEPSASFSFDYDATAGTVTIDHTSGEIIAADTLSVRGSGFADRTSVDQTAAGPWQGDTSQDGDVSAGHSVVVGVQEDWQLAVVWDDGTNSTVLESDVRTADVAPTASFSFDYDSSQSSVEVTAASVAGDGIDPTNFFVLGQDIDGSENDYPGQWNPDDTDSNGRITAGQSTMVGVSSDAWAIKLVWDNGETSSWIARDVGPGA